MKHTPQGEQLYQVAKNLLEKNGRDLRYLDFDTWDGLIKAVEQYKNNEPFYGEVLENMASHSSESASTGEPGDSNGMLEALTAVDGDPAWFQLSESTRDLVKSCLVYKPTLPESSEGKGEEKRRIYGKHLMAQPSAPPQPTDHGMKNNVFDIKDDSIYTAEQARYIRDYAYTEGIQKSDFDHLNDKEQYGKEQFCKGFEKATLKFRTAQPTEGEKNLRAKVAHIKELSFEKDKRIGALEAKLAQLKSGEPATGMPTDIIAVLKAIDVEASTKEGIKRGSRGHGLIVDLLRNLKSK